MRIVAGELGGRRLRGPARGSGGDVRPTTDRVREALFSILGDVRGLTVLDLFAGTGALGIEAVSRGAAAATLVDRRAETAERNVADLGLGDRVTVVASDAARFLARSDERFQLVFCDPPYSIAPRLGPSLDKHLPDRLLPGARVIVEFAAGAPVELSLPILDERSWGGTSVRIHGEATA